MASFTMLTAIRMNNWKSHQETTLRFASGVNTLVGMNGAGKSSVMQAISFALFGTFPQLQRRTMVLEDLVTRKPVQKDRASVELDFSVDGKNYTVSRSIEKKGKKFVTAEAELREGGQLKEANNEAVTRLVESLLHIDYDLFTKAVYSEQNGLDAFLRLPRGARMKEIDHMLQLERYENVRAGAVSLANRLSAQAEEKRRLLAGLDEAGLEGKHQSLEKEIQSLREQQSKSAALSETIETEKQQLAQRIAALEQAARQVQHQQSLILSLEAAVRELERIPAASPVPAEEFTRLQKEQESQASAVTALNKEMEEGREQLAAANVAVAAIKESIQELAVLGAVCPVCESPLPEETKARLAASREEKKTALLTEAAACAQAVQKIKEKKAALEQAVAATAAALGAVQLQQALNEQAEAQARRLQQKQQELSAARTQLPPAVDESELAGLRTSLAAVAGKAGALDSSVRALQSVLSDKLSQLSQIQKQLDYIKTEAAAATKAASAGEHLATFSRVLQSTQEALRAAFLNTVNTALTSIWPVLYPYGDFPGLELAVDEGDYVLRLQEKSRWVPAELVSGGERSAAALALRIAFSLSFLPHLRWLVLDEPTHNLDAAAVKRLAEILQSSAAFADQVFLITHEERLAVGNVIRLARDKGQDLPTVVQE